jgi:hypothetical protein
MDERPFHVEKQIVEEQTGELLATAGTKLIRGEWREARQLYERVLGLAERADAPEGFAVASWC